MFQDEFHKGPMSRSDALRWLREWEIFTGYPKAFQLGWRTVSEWKTHPSHEVGESGCCLICGERVRCQQCSNSYDEEKDGLGLCKDCSDTFWNEHKTN